MDRRGCKFIVSDHAFTRAVQRHITAEDIKAALLDGKRIFDFRKKCCVFVKRLKTRETVHVITDFSGDTIITVYKSKPKKRRRK